MGALGVGPLMLGDEKTSFKPFFDPRDSGFFLYISRNIVQAYFFFVKL